MKIIVQHNDKSLEIITLTEPLTVIRGGNLNRIVTSTGFEHWFDQEGYYDCWGMSCNIAVPDDASPNLPPEALEIIEQIDAEREFPATGR